MARQKYSRSSIKKYARRKRPAWVPGAGYGPKTTAAIAAATNNLNARLSSVESNMRAEETKKKFIQFNEVIVNNGVSLPVWTLLNPLSQGDTASTIDGISYSLRGIAMKMYLHNNSGVSGYVRLAILRLKSGQQLSTTGENLFTGGNQLGLSYTSATEQQRLYHPLNTKRYDVIMQRVVKIGAKNSTYTDNFDCNQIVKGYKRYKNRKEFINTDTGSMDTNYYLVAWAVDSALDFNTITVELSGETCFYYKDN